MAVDLPSDPERVSDWVASLDETAVRACLETLVKEQIAVSGLLKQLDEKMDRAYQQTLRTLQAARAIRPPAIPEAHLPVYGVPAPVGKTAQVLRAMGQNAPTRVWTAQELHEALIGYGWATDSEGDYASLLSTLSRMVRDSAIHRVERGLYSIAPRDEVRKNLAAITSQQE